jgi:hypothetical protein
MDLVNVKTSSPADDASTVQPPYEKPELTEFGTVRELTLGINGHGRDNATGHGSSNNAGG